MDAAAGTISELRLEIVGLKAQLQTVGISEAREIAIRNEIVENKKQINILLSQSTEDPASKRLKAEELAYNEGLADDYIALLKASIGYLSCDGAPFLSTAFWVSETMVMTSAHAFKLKKKTSDNVVKLNNESKNIKFNRFDSNDTVALTIHFVDTVRDVAVLICMGKSDAGMVPIKLHPRNPKNLMPIILVSAELANSCQCNQQKPKFYTSGGCVTAVLDEVPDNVMFFYEAVTTAGMSGAPIILNKGNVIGIGVGMHSEAISEDSGKVRGQFPTAISSLTLKFVLSNALAKLNLE